jgi:hypothetical protein
MHALTASAAPDISCCENETGTGHRWITAPSATNWHSQSALRSRAAAPLRRIITEHAPDDARQMLAERVVEHLEQSGFEIDEAEQVMRKRQPTEPGPPSVAVGASSGRPRSPRARLSLAAALGRGVDRGPGPRGLELGLGFAKLLRPIGPVPIGVARW